MKDVVHPATTTVHRDADVGVPQRVREGKARELRALIRVEDPEHAGAVTQKSHPSCWTAATPEPFKVTIATPTS